MVEALVPASAIEPLLEDLASLDFTRLAIVAQFLLAERKRLQLKLEEAEQINEEWRLAVDRQGAELRALREHDERRSRGLVDK